MKADKIVISGTTGFLGNNLERHFKAQGKDVKSLTRSDFSSELSVLVKKLEGAKAIIHLAGAPIIKRWTKRYQEKIYNSRVLTTRRLVEAMHHLQTHPECFISASAVGIYSDEGVHDEESKMFSEGFLGRVCRDWEAEAMRSNELCRSLMFRFGIILGKDGGALKQLLMPFKLGLGGRIASGRQIMSWIHIDDVLSAFDFALKNPNVYGPVNLTTMNPVTNNDFTRTLGKTLRKPAVLPLPAMALKMAFGKGAIVLTDGQCALPKKLTKNGFKFQYDDIASALKNLLQ